MLAPAAPAPATTIRSTARTLPREAVDRAGPRDRVELAGGSLAERGQLRDAHRLAAGGDDLAVLLAETPHEARAPIAVDIAPAQRRHVPAAVDEAADDRAIAVRMAVHGDRHDELAGAVGLLVLEDGAPFVDVPAVVLETGAHLRRVVDLLPAASTHVADPQVTGRAVEREAPGVPQPVADDLGLRMRRVDVDPEQLAEQRVEVLRSVLRVSLGAAVAHADVESAVRAEGQLAAVVVRVRLGDEEELPGRARNCTPAVRAVSDDAGVPAAVGVVDVEA